MYDGHLCFVVISFARIESSSNVTVCLSLVVFQCKFNRCLSSCDVGITGEVLKFKFFVAFILGGQMSSAGGFLK